MFSSDYMPFKVPVRLKFVCIMAAISKEEYLKRYLSDDSSKEKKKKRKKGKAVKLSK